MADLMNRTLTPEERAQIKDQLRLIQQQVEHQSQIQPPGFFDTMFKWIGGGVTVGWTIASLGAFYRAPAPFRMSFLSTYRRPEAITLCANLGLMFGLFTFAANEMGYSTSGTNKNDPLRFRNVLPQTLDASNTLQTEKVSP